MKPFRLFIEEGVNDPSIFKAVYLVGAPGAGKTFASHKIAFKAMGFVIINSDAAFEILMKKNKLSLIMKDDEEEQRNKVRDRAKTITKNKSELAIRGRLGLIIDGTGKDFNALVQSKKNLERIGYDTAMVFINVTDETSRKRNVARGQQGDRTVPEKIRSKAFSAVQDNIGKFQKEFGRSTFFIIDNNDDSDIESQTMNVFKQIRKFAKAPPTKPQAKKWIDSHK